MDRVTQASRTLPLQLINALDSSQRLTSNTYLTPCCEQENAAVMGVSEARMRGKTSPHK